MTDSESIEQTLARLREQHVPYNELYCEVCSDIGDEVVPWPCETARLLEHIEGLQAALRAMAS